MKRVVCWFRGHDWARVKSGIYKGRACRRCYYSDQISPDVFRGEDGILIYGRFEGIRQWEWL